MDSFLTSAHDWIDNRSPWLWLIALGAAFLIAFVLKFLLKTVSGRLRKYTKSTKSRWDDVFTDLLDGLKLGVIFVWAFYLLAQLLNPPANIHRFLQFFVVVFSCYQVGIWGFYIIRNWRDDFVARKMTHDNSSAAVFGLMYAAIQTVFICTLILMGLNNLGVDIGALIAGLGVGGIAIALAAQNVLGDLMASLSIVLDKPFLIDDFIVVGNDMGTVEKIGIKTTRVRSLSGEELVFSNKDLLENRIHNYKRMYQRRVVQSFSVVYSTSAEVMAKIPGWVKSFVEKHKELRFDRCHFIKYGASSLDFELVFWVNSPDQNLFMDLQQALLLDIMVKFNAENVLFAYPTQTLFIEKVSLPEAQKQNSESIPDSRGSVDHQNISMRT